MVHLERWSGLGSFNIITMVLYERSFRTQIKQSKYGSGRSVEVVALRGFYCIVFPTRLYMIRRLKNIDRMCWCFLSLGRSSNVILRLGSLRSGVVLFDVVLCPSNI